VSAKELPRGHRQWSKDDERVLDNDLHQNRTARYSETPRAPKWLVGVSGPDWTERPREFSNVEAHAFSIGFIVAVEYRKPLD
jgi:hypothetical protein